MNLPYDAAEGSPICFTTPSQGCQPLLGPGRSLQYYLTESPQTRCCPSAISFAAPLLDGGMAP